MKFIIMIHQHKYYLNIFRAFRESYQKRLETNGGGGASRKKRGPVS